MLNLGIIFAIVAMLSWAVGDFMIQRSTRRFGNWETLFVITFFGVLILLPFVWKDLPILFYGNFDTMKILLLSGGIITLAAMLEFESLREGKLSIIEPIWSLEIPASVLFSYIFIGEHITGLQILLILAIILGLMSLSFKGGKVTARHFLERGARLAVVAAVFMGAADFMLGFSGRMTNAFMTNFVACFVMALVSGVYLVYKGRMQSMIRDVRHHPKFILGMSIADNIAWVAFVSAMGLAPIGIVVALTESYIIFTVLLGVFVNKEKLIRHQVFGLVLALISAITLAIVTV